MSAWPLVGRVAELNRLRVLVRDVACPGVLLAGSAGVGKTRLALECLAVAEQAGLATARVTATRSAAGLPFGAVAALLGPAEPAAGPGTRDRLGLLQRSAAALLERAAGRRLVLLVDDAHLLDDTSATLVQQLAATNAAFVLVTVRAGAPAPDAIVALWKDGTVQRVELGGLPAAAVEDLLATVLGGPVDRAASAALAVRCQGNVLFLRELVLGALTDGALRDDGGIWRLVGPLFPSKRLVELVESRLSGLEASERALLEVVSFGEPLGPCELAALADPALAENLERNSLLTSEIDGRRLQIRLAHPLYGDVVRAGMPALRVRNITRSLAEVVEATGARRREDTLRVATWRLSGGGASPGMTLAAATTARWRFDFPLAERLARAADDAGAGFDAALLAAQLASLQGRGSQAEAELADLAAHATNDMQRRAVTLTRLDNAIFGRGSIDAAWRAMEQVGATIADPDWRDEVAALRSWMLILTRGHRAGANAAEPLLGSAKGRALVWACLAASYSFGPLGRIDASLEAATRGHKANLALGEPLAWYPWMSLWHRCLALAYAGRFEEAEELATREYQQALAERSVERQAYFAWFLAQTVGERGRVRTAASHAREALALFRQLNRPLHMRDSMLQLRLALALSGSADDAALALAEHDTLGPPDTLWTIDRLQARAWTAAAAGDLPEARDVLEAAARVGEEDGHLVGAAAALHGLARLGHAKQVMPRLAAVAAQIEGDLAAARTAHVEALVTGDPVSLEDVSGSFEAMGADLLAAEAAADAAVAWRQAGNPRAAASVERRAAAIAERCEGATTPALRAVKARAILTPAEREAALLAGAGRSNREIADELHLSVRTVESRLQHVYEKLGVSGRAQLGAHLSKTD